MQPDRAQGAQHQKSLDQWPRGLSRIDLKDVDPKDPNKGQPIGDFADVSNALGVLHMTALAHEHEPNGSLQVAPDEMRIRGVHQDAFKRLRGMMVKDVTMPGLVDIIVLTSEGSCVVKLARSGAQVTVSEVNPFGQTERAHRFLAGATGAEHVQKGARMIMEHSIGATVIGGDNPT